MLVVDRRLDPGAHIPDDNKQEPDEHGQLESSVIPAQIEVDEYLGIGEGVEGVATVVQTPGPNAIIGKLLERIWGAR